MKRMDILLAITVLVVSDVICEVKSMKSSDPLGSLVYV